MQAYEHRRGAECVGACVGVLLRLFSLGQLQTAPTPAAWPHWAVDCFRRLALAASEHACSQLCEELPGQPSPSCRHARKRITVHCFWQLGPGPTQSRAQHDLTWPDATRQDKTVFAPRPSCVDVHMYYVHTCEHVHPSHLTLVQGLPSGRMRFRLRVPGTGNKPNSILSNRASNPARTPRSGLTTHRFLSGPFQFYCSGPGVSACPA